MLGLLSADETRVLSAGSLQHQGFAPHLLHRPRNRLAAQAANLYQPGFAQEQLPQVPAALPYQQGLAPQLPYQPELPGQAYVANPYHQGLAPQQPPQMTEFPGQAYVANPYQQQGFILQQPNQPNLPGQAHVALPYQQQAPYHGQQQPTMPPMHPDFGLGQQTAFIQPAPVPPMNQAQSREQQPARESLMNEAQSREQNREEESVFGPDFVRNLLNNIGSRSLTPSTNTPAPSGRNAASTPQIQQKTSVESHVYLYSQQPLPKLAWSVQMEKHQRKQDYFHVKHIARTLQEQKAQKQNCQNMPAAESTGKLGPTLPLVTSSKRRKKT